MNDFTQLFGFALTSVSKKLPDLEYLLNDFNCSNFGNLPDWYQDKFRIGEAIFPNSRIERFLFNKSIPSAHVVFVDFHHRDDVVLYSKLIVRFVRWHLHWKYFHQRQLNRIHTKYSVIPLPGITSAFQSFEPNSPSFFAIGGSVYGTSKQSSFDISEYQYHFYSRDSFTEMLTLVGLPFSF